jgi:hypothetical protein
MAIFYLAVAIVLLFTSFFDTLQREIRIPIGILLGIYGLFRIIRALRKLFTRKSE